MPAQKPQWFFQPRSSRNGTSTRGDDTAPGLTSLPTALLRRHGARVLDPEKAAAVHGFPSPRSTVYRAMTLLVASAIDGSPAGHSGGGLTANPNSSSGVTGPSSTDSYVYNGGDTRSPFALLLDPPHRRSAAECQDDYGRRPVVAVLDTGVRA